MGWTFSFSISISIIFEICLQKRNIFSEKWSSVKKENISFLFLIDVISKSIANACTYISELDSYKKIRNESTSCKILILCPAFSRLLQYFFFLFDLFIFFICFGLSNSFALRITEKTLINKSWNSCLIVKKMAPFMLFKPIWERKALQL